MVVAMKRSTAKVAVRFMKDTVIPPFGAPKTALSYTATCFTPFVLQDFIKQHETKWCTVLSYSPMCNERAERTVGTQKRIIGQVVTGKGQDWYSAIKKALSSYFRQPIRGRTSPFELLYGAKKFMATDTMRKVTESAGYRDIEPLAVHALRAERSDKQTERISKKGPTFQKGYLVLVAYDTAFGDMKWPAVKQKYYGPGTVINAQNPCYELALTTGRRSQILSHTWRLLDYGLRA